MADLGRTTAFGSRIDKFLALADRKPIMCATTSFNRDLLRAGSLIAGK